MEEMNPKIRDILNFRHKLWDQLIVMSEFKLDVDSSFSISNTETFHVLFRKVSYQEDLRSYRYYGKIIRGMLHITFDCQDLQKKEKLIYVIANFYSIRWNKKLLKIV